MYTQCPECQTIYEIDEDALQASLGIVHCGRCSKRFDALRSLSDTLPIKPIAAMPEHDPLARAPTLTDAVPASAADVVARQNRGVESSNSADAESGSHPQPAAPATASSSAAETRSGENPEDWFAAFESELNAPPAHEASDSAIPNLADDNGWAVELPDETDRKGITRTASSDLTDGGDEAAPVKNPDDASEAALLPHEDEANAPAPRDPASSSDAAPSQHAIDLEPPVFEASEQGYLDTDAPAEDNSAHPAAADAEPYAAIPLAPVYVRPHQKRFTRAGVAWALGCVVLAMALAAQLAWAKRVELFRNPSTHAWMAWVCQTISCRLPPMQDLSHMELLSRDVRPDPNAAGALMITATVRNDAAFRQPWPIVVVELTDLDNHVVAMRRFRPAEYMPDPVRRTEGIAPGATAALAFEVADPGKRAVAFQFGFE